MFVFFSFEQKLRADLDRQRAKGPNQHSAKIQTIENQIRDYEQKQNEIKRRLTIIDVGNLLDLIENNHLFTIVFVLATIRLWNIKKQR